MEFHNRLYQLRKQEGLSQEELANRLCVSRQTISKWELGDSTPDMEKLVAISDLFEISLDQLVLGKEPSIENTVSSKSEILNIFNEKFLTPDNKRRTKRGLKIAGIILAIIFLIDILSLIIVIVFYSI